MAVPGLTDWQNQILAGVGAPVTPANLTALNAWQRAEGGTAANNPFNTTQGMPGATPYNTNSGFPVLNYPTPQAGIEATIKTLNNGRYADMITALKQGSNPMAFANALAASPWGTGALVQKILAGGGPIPSPTLPTGGVPTAAAGSATLPASSPSLTRTTLEQPNFIPAILGSLGKGPEALLSGILNASMQAKLQTTTVPGAPGSDVLGPPAPTSVPTSTVPSTGSQPVPTGPGGLRAGLAEAFYDPIGSYDTNGGPTGAFGGPIGGHSDHVHISASTPQEMLRAIRTAQSMGLHVGENAYVGDVPESGVHVSDSYHYKTFPGKYNGRSLGQAIDVSGSPDSMAAFYRAMTGFKGK